MKAATIVKAFRFLLSGKGFLPVLTFWSDMKSSFYLHTNVAKLCLNVVIVLALSYQGAAQTKSDEHTTDKPQPEASSTQKQELLSNISAKDLQDLYLQSAKTPKQSKLLSADLTGAPHPTSVTAKDLREELKRRGLFDALMQSEEKQLADASNQALLDAYQTAVEDGASPEDPVNVSIPNKPAITVRLKALKQVLSKRGLLEPFAAVFNGALALAATGNSSVRSAQDAIQPQFRGTIDWESEHFAGDNGWSKYAHFSFGGTFGYAPIMLLTDLQKNDAAQPGPPRPLFQQGLVWDITPRLNTRAFDEGEFSIFGRFGQSWYTSEVTSFKAGDDTIVATVTNNNVNRAATFWETGAEFRIFNKPLHIIHGEKSYITPKFSVSGGFRDDTRFKRAGEISDYDTPESRTFVRFLVTLDKVLFPKTQDQPQSFFSASFGVDYERPLDDDRVPAATRLLFKSDFDLFKLFQSGKLEKQNPQPGNGNGGGS